MNHPEAHLTQVGTSPPTEPHDLAPGESCTVPIKSMGEEYGRHSYWLLPGEYTLYATCSVSVTPAPKNSYFTDMIDVEPAPLRLKVVAAE